MKRLAGGHTHTHTHTPRTRSSPMESSARAVNIRRPHPAEAAMPEQAPCAARGALGVDYMERGSRGCVPFALSRILEIEELVVARECEAAAALLDVERPATAPNGSDGCYTLKKKSWFFCGPIKCCESQRVGGGGEKEKKTFFFLFFEIYTCVF